MTVCYLWGLLVAAMVGSHVSAQPAPERRIDFRGFLFVRASAGHGSGPESACAS